MTETTERDWRLKATRYTQTCTFCGRSVAPHTMFFRDLVSWHLNAHRDCLNKSLSGEP